MTRQAFCANLCAVAVIPRLDLRTSQQLVMTPQLSQAIGLLALSNVEIEAAVADEVERNPLLAVTMSEEGLRLLRARSEAEQRAYLERDERLISRVLALLEDAGVHPAVPAAVLLGLLRSLVMLGAHRADVGESLADELAAWLVPTLRAALIGPAVRRDE